MATFWHWLVQQYVWVILLVVVLVAIRVIRKSRTNWDD